MVRTASKPSISGICTSMSTRSKLLASSACERLAAVGGDDHRMAQSLEHADGHLLVDRDDPRPARCAVRLRRRVGCEPGSSAVWLRTSVFRAGSDGHQPSSGRRRARTGAPAWSGRRRSRGAASSDASSGWPAEVRSISRTPAIAGSPRIWRASSRPSMPGIIPSISAIGNGWPRRPRLAGLPGRPRPPSTAIGRVPQFVRTSSRMRRLVALSSTIRTGRPSSRGSSDRRWRAIVLGLARPARR